MKNTGSIGKKEYKIYSNNVNAQAEMPVSQVAEMLIDSASRHAENNGFGYANLINNNHSWVLLRLVFELSHYPKVNDTVVVETWVEGFNKHFTSRNFKILTSDGEVLGYARSIWTVINMETRDAVDLSDYSAIS